MSSLKSSQTSSVQYNYRYRSGASNSDRKPLCQKCLSPGHWTYECKNEPLYKSRPSRTKLLSTKKNTKEVKATTQEIKEVPQRDGLADAILKKRKRQRADSDDDVDEDSEVDKEDVE